MINEIIKEDSTFSESGFIAKVDNTFIMLLTAIMLGNLSRVKHKISDELEMKYQDIINKLNANNERQMYDELNVKETHITNISVLDDKFIIDVQLVSRYMDYIVDKTTRKYKSGINTYRVEKNNHLVFEKKRNAKQEGVAKKCPSCGANINTNYSGKCEYCGSIYDTENYDWVLVSLD